MFPIQDFKKEKELQYISYDLEEPKYDVDECREKGQSYVAQLKVTVNLSTYSLSPESGELEFAAAIQEEVFFCDLPLMTENGTFIINGTERVIVSQLYRSPGVFFNRKKLKNTAGIREVLSAQLFQIVVLGLTLSLMRKTYCMYRLIVDANFQRRFSCEP